MECQAEIFARKVLQLAFEMGVRPDHYGWKLPDGSVCTTLLSGLADTPGFMEIHPPYTTEYTEKTVREYVTE